MLTAEERNCAEKIMIQDLSFIDLGWQKIVWPDIDCFCVFDTKK